MGLVSELDQVFDREEKFLRKWGTYGDGDGELSEPGGIAIDGDGRVYVVEPHNCRIQVFKRVALSD